MALVVVSYPNISLDDLSLIQSVRAEHDRYYRVIAPHFTFVFPVYGIEQSAFVEHVKRQAEGVRKIPFVVRCAMVVMESGAAITHVFLVPDEGYSDIVKLHDRLYRSMLAPELRLDIAFIPHIGVGNATDPQACKDLADDLNQREPAIRGTVDSLDVASYEGDGVTTIERIELV